MLDSAPGDSLAEHIHWPWSFLNTNSNNNNGPSLNKHHRCLLWLHLLEANCINTGAATVRRRRGVYSNMRDLQLGSRFVGALRLVYDLSIRGSNFHVPREPYQWSVVTVSSTINTAHPSPPSKFGAAQASCAYNQLLVAGDASCMPKTACWPPQASVYQPEHMARLDYPLLDLFCPGVLLLMSISQGEGVFVHQ